MQTTDKNAPAPTQFVIMPVATGNSLDKYSELQSRVNGGLQVLVGILAIIDYSYFLVLHHGVPILGYGISCGLMFIVAGSLGISTGRGRTKCKIVAFMTLSIIASAFSVIFFITGAFSIYDNRRTYHYSCTEHDYDVDTQSFNITIDHECRYAYNAALGTSICMLILAVLEAGISIWGSSICCIALCCGASDQAAGVLYQTSATAGGLVSNQTEQIQMSPVSLQAVTLSPQHDNDLGHKQFDVSPATISHEHDALPSSRFNDQDVGRYYQLQE